MSITLLQIASSFLFLDGIEPFFGHHFSMCPSTKLFFFDFWFRPPKAQNLLPKICTKSPVSQLVWQIDWRCLGLPGGFRGWLIQWNLAKCCGADPCCHGNEILARHGDPVAYRLVIIICLCVHLSLHSKTLLAQCLEKYLTDFHHTYTRTDGSESVAEGTEMNSSNFGVKG